MEQDCTRGSFERDEVSDQVLPGDAPAAGGPAALRLEPAEIAAPPLKRVAWPETGDGLEANGPAGASEYGAAFDWDRYSGHGTEDYAATEYGLHFRSEARVAPAPGAGSPVLPLPAAEPGRPGGFWREAKSLARDVVFAAVSAILIVWFVVQPVKVEGTSMVPQLENGERIFVNKFIYSFDTIHRGDVVVFWFPNNPSQSFIKRVIGLPGETIRVESGRLYINNKPYHEPYLSHEHTRNSYHLPPTEVLPHHYFVMGDNRDASNDSRHWGLVPEKYIYGKAMFRYWPPGSFGTISVVEDDQEGVR